MVLSFFAFCKYRGTPPLNEASENGDERKGFNTRSTIMTPKTALKKVYSVSWQTIRFVMAVSLVILLPMSYMEMKNHQRNVPLNETTTFDKGTIDVLRALGPLIHQAVGGGGVYVPIIPEHLTAVDNSTHVTTPSPSIVNTRTIPNITMRNMPQDDGGGGGEARGEGGGESKGKETFIEYD